MNDGHYCKYNFVWSSRQIKLFRNLKYDPFVLGLPYNIRIPKKVSNKIILIGHGEEKSNTYEKTLHHFKLIYSLIDKDLFDVEYRPHTYESTKIPKKYFSKINNENKLNLLQDSKKIYIGFVSSLLYEASMHDNYVIGLDESLFQVYLDFEYDISFKEKDYYQLNNYLKTIRFKTKKNKKNNIELNKRFMHCLNKINKCENLV